MLEVTKSEQTWSSFSDLVGKACCDLFLREALLSLLCLTLLRCARITTGPLVVLRGFSFLPWAACEIKRWLFMFLETYRKK